MIQLPIFGTLNVPNIGTITLEPVLINDARAAAPCISALEGVSDELARATHVADSRGCSLTRGLDVKLFLDAPAGLTVLSAVGAGPSA